MGLFTRYAMDALMKTSHPEVIRRQCWNLHPHRTPCTACKDSIDLARYFIDGESLSYSCTVADENIATISVDKTILTVNGVADGSTIVTIQAGSKSQTITITVRKNAGENGWL